MDILEWKVLALRVVVEYLRIAGLNGDVRVFELHPAGGQSYSLAVIERIENGRYIRRLTVRMNELFVSGVDAPIIIRNENETLRPLQDILTELKDVVPSSSTTPLNNPDPISETISLIADIQETLVKSVLKREVFCGWHDSSGYEGCFIIPLIGLDERFNPGGRWALLPGRETMMEAGRYWFIDPIEEDARTSVVIRLDGKVWIGDSASPVSLSDLEGSQLLRDC